MRKWLFLTVVSVLGILGCSDSNTSTNTGGNSTGPTGTLRGGDGKYNITQLRDARFRFLKDKSGILVQCEGTSFSAVTDSNGFWEIHNLPTSTYSISFSKAGYTTFKNTSFQFVGGGIQLYNSSITLLQPITFSYTLDAVVTPTLKDKWWYVYGHTSDNAPDSVNIFILYVLSHSSTIEIEDVESAASSFTDDVNTSFSTHDGSFSFKSPITSGLQNFQYGDTVFVRAFPYLYTQNYYDVASKKTIVTGYGQGSNVLSAIVP